MTTKKAESMKKGLIKRIQSITKEAKEIEELIEYFKEANPKYLKGFFKEKLDFSEEEYEDVCSEFFEVIERLEGIGEDNIVAHLEVTLMLKTLINKTFIKEFVKYIKNVQAKEKEA